MKYFIDNGKKRTEKDEDGMVDVVEEMDANPSPFDWDITKDKLPPLPNEK